MKYRLLELLACPACGQRLHVKTAQEVTRPRLPVPVEERPCLSFCGAHDLELPLSSPTEVDCADCLSRELREGELICNHGHEFLVRGGVPVILPEDLRGKQAATAKVFGYEWLRYRVQLEEEDRKVFLAETLSAPSDFFGRLVLDAGCGMGRYTRIAAEMAREVVGLDLSPAVTALFPLSEKSPWLHVVRGDLLHPPFRPEVFDFVYSLGVLHHTPDTKQALRSIVRLARKGGTISFWVYGRAGDYQNFLSNPLEEKRANFFSRHPRLHRPYWLGVKCREKVSDTLRLFTTRLPTPLLYYLCLFLVPFGALPLLKYFTFSSHPLWRVRWQENFDWLSPPFQFKHTKEEVREWISELGLSEEGMLSHGLIPKIGFKLKKN